jgi:hypothetical protein
MHALAMPTVKIPEGEQQDERDERRDERDSRQTLVAPVQ